MKPYSGLPDPFAPTEQKETLEYGLATANHLNDRRVQGSLSIYTPGGAWWFLMMHQYWEGRQDINQYINVYRGIGTYRSQSNPNGNLSDDQTENPLNQFREFDRKGLNNISFEVKTFMPKLTSVVSSLLNDADVFIEVDSLDPHALREKEKAKWSMYYGSKLLNPLRKEAGLPEKKYDWRPQTKEELELFEKNHGFKMPFETGLKKVLDHTFDISHWKHIFSNWKRSQMIERFICGKVCCNDEGAVIIKYIPTSDYITDYLEKQPFDEPQFAGHLERRKISDIAPILLAQGKTEGDILGLAKSNAQLNGYSADGSYDFQASDPVTGRFLWYDFYVNVFCFQMRSQDLNYYRKYKKADGTLRYSRMNPVLDKDTNKYFYKANNNRDNIEVDRIENQTVYEGEWIIGSDCMLKWERKKNIIFNSDGTACLDYFHVYTPGQSMTERVKTNCDQYMMNWLKYQAHVLAAMPPGGTVDVGVLALMDFGWGQIKGPDWLRIARETGWKFLRSNELMIKNRIKPSEALTSEENGPGDGAFKWLQLMAAQIDEAREMLGISAAVEGSPSKGPELVGLMEGQQIATGHALFADHEALVYAKEIAARKVIALSRILIQNIEKSSDYYEGVIGKPYVEEIKRYENLSANQIGLRIRTAPTKERKERIRQMVEVALSEGRNGVRLIDFEDALLIDKWLEEGYFDWAIWYFSLTKQRNAMKRQAEAEAEMQRNAQIQTEAAQAAEQAKRDTAKLLEDLKTNRELTLEEKKGMIESALSKQQHLERMAELDREGWWETQKAIKKGQEDLEISGNL